MIFKFRGKESAVPEGIFVSRRGTGGCHLLNMELEEGVKKKERKKMLFHPRVLQIRQAREFGVFFRLP